MKNIFTKQEVKINYTFNDWRNLFRTKPLIFFDNYPLCVSVRNKGLVLKHSIDVLKTFNSHVFRLGSVYGVWGDINKHKQGDFTHCRPREEDSSEVTGFKCLTLPVKTGAWLDRCAANQQYFHFPLLTDINGPGAAPSERPCRYSTPLVRALGRLNIAVLSIRGSQVSYMRRFRPLPQHSDGAPWPERGDISPGDGRFVSQRLWKLVSAVG